jgi:chromodomain-helicase-DNA-binding protein 7
VAAAKEGEAFLEEGIDQILSGRTEKRQIGGRAGNSFSVATFAAPEVRVQDGTTERDYWQKLMPEALEKFDEEVRRASMCRL